MALLKKVSIGFGTVILAILLAFGLYKVREKIGGETKIGAWSTSAYTGSSESGMFHRTYVAITGLLALTRSEVVYFNAVKDDDGAPLLTSCRYKVTGKAFPSAWWSITAYADDHFLIPNAEKRYSYSNKSLETPYAITISREKAEGNWLPSGTTQGFSLLFRAYKAEKSLVENINTAPLPSIKKEACS